MCGFRHVNCLLFCFGCFVIGHIRQGIARIKRAQAAPDPSQVLLAPIRHRWTPVLSVCCLCQIVRIPPPRMRGGNSYITCHLREHVGLVFYQFQTLLVGCLENKYGFLLLKGTICNFRLQRYDIFLTYTRKSTKKAHNQIKMSGRTGLCADSGSIRCRPFAVLLPSFCRLFAVIDSEGAADLQLSCRAAIAHPSTTQTL